MNKPQNTAKKYAATERKFRYVGVLLLFVFIGRVALVSVYGYAGVPKPYISVIADNDNEQNNDKKDENKYTESQFKCVSPNEGLLTDPVYILLFKSHSYSYKNSFFTTHAISVLTPPPNC